MIEMDLHTISANSGVKDENNAYWYITEIDGWDGPSLNTTTVNADTRDGGYVANIQLNPRTITLTGVCKIDAGGVEANFWASRDKLLGILASFTTARLFKVMEYPSPKQVSWYPMGDPKIQIHAGWFDWSIQIVCPDPRKYAVQQTSITVQPTQGGAATATTVVNLGNYPTTFFMDVNGTPDASYRMPQWNVSQVIAGTQTGYVQTTASGDPTYSASWYAYDSMPYTISSYDKSFMASNGASYYSTLQQSNLKWFDLQPGVQTINNLTYGGSSNPTNTGVTYTIRYRSAWL